LKKKAQTPLPSPPKTVEAFAPAKINLTLHVTGQRDDGYHLLDSLVGFARVGDRITVTEGPMSLEIDGPFGPGLAADEDNLVMRAARWLDPEREAKIKLTKNLPIASGIGGGSSDAAATIRALSKLWNVPIPGDHKVVGLGADVPVCLSPEFYRMEGIGEQVYPVRNLPDLDILLVNPGISVSTPDVFSRLAIKDNAPMSPQLPSWDTAVAFCDWLEKQRNDLAKPAADIAPEIADALELISETDCLFAGMSGSGATCFGLYLPDGYTAKAARAHMFVERPDWWCVNTNMINERGKPARD